MTSLINPNNIDGAYPVAGQDNNSQGFRDNFTNTRTNFQYAADEITDLQNKAVLKSALTGTTLNNNMNGSILSNVQFQDVSQTRVALGSLSGSVTLNYAAGSYQTVTTSGPISLNFINFPPAGALGKITVQINIVSKAHTVTAPAAVSVNGFGIIGLYAPTNTFTAPVPGVYTFTFSTSDGGTTITVSENNTLLRPYNSSADLITNGGNVGLGTTYSIYNPTPLSTPGTATLPNGVPGQVKVIGSLGSSSLTLSVPDAGSAVTNIVFNDVGSLATLTWSQDFQRWFVISTLGNVVLS